MDHDLNCAHGSMALTLSFLAIDEAAKTVQVNISVSHLTSEASLDWAAFEEWVLERELSVFEEQLFTAQEAALHNARGEPLLRIIKTPDAEFIELGSATFPPNARSASALARIATAPGLGLALGKAFRGYAKWW